jgi:two-component system LytT family response regulator
MKKLKTIIIDDEKDAVQLLSLELLKMQDRVKLIASFNSPLDAVAHLKNNEIDLLFLDIDMPNMNGFELLNQLQPFNFAVVFVTAYDKFAIKAFRYQALDYITKPVDSLLLADTIDRASKRKISEEQIFELKSSKLQYNLNKIAVPTSKGLIFININDICCIEASDNYSVVHLKNNQKITCSRTLKEMEQIFDEKKFFRVHRQFIVNLEEVVHLNKSEGLLSLSNQMVVSVSREQKENLVLRYKSI